MQEIESDKPFYEKAAYFSLFLLLTGFLLQYGSSIFIPLAFSFILAFLVLPISNSLEKIKFPRWLASLIGVLLIGLVIVFVIVLLGYELTSLMDNSSIYAAKLNEKFQLLQTYIKQEWGISKSQQNVWIDKQIQSTGQSSGTYLMGIFGTTTTLAINGFLVFILTYFLLAERDRFKSFLKQVDVKYHYHTFDLINKIGMVSQAYLKGLFIDTIILTVLNFLGYAYFGLDYALLFAVLAAVLNIIPYIGGVVGSLFPVVMALVTMDSPWSALGILGVGMFVQFLDNNFIGPKVIGSSVSINPLFSTLALLAGSLIWGVSGMLLAMPLAGMLKVYFDNTPTLQPYGYLIGEEDKYGHHSLRLKADINDKVKKIVNFRKTKG